jgi:hypothetical protein
MAQTPVTVMANALETAARQAEPRIVLNSGPAHPI